MSRLARLKTCFARVAQSPREALSRGKHRHATDAHSGERRIRASTLKRVLEFLHTEEALGHRGGRGAYAALCGAAVSG